MLNEIMRHIRNYFPVPNGYHGGKFTIHDGTLDLPFLLEGQYFLIEGSRLNDGVYQHPAFVLNDETFDGWVTELAPPADFLELVNEIQEWQAAYATTDKIGPYSSESFGGYSYTRATNSSGNAVGWKDAFQNRLNTWRKL